MSHVKTSILLSILVFLSFATISAQEPSAAPVAADLTTWVNVAPADAGFTILMPSKAPEKVTPLQGHPDIENHVIALETELAGYVVSYMQLAEEVTDPAKIKELLDRGREGGIASTGGQLKREKEIKLSGYSGREWNVEIPGGLVATTRAYWVKRRLYQTVFITSPKDSDSPEVTKLRQDAGKKFLDSFVLNGMSK
ncbi:MAG TPA: hypothetical protein VIF64_08200 [Pyrinomonadaceae bacterium]|jgi:hypothetical protein